ncbi:MAG TPA: MarR family transcriptional regulator [Solirubrobacteraceae bacterium]|jgi:DNA-binding MarR family transcriptional regulator
MAGSTKSSGAGTAKSRTVTASVAPGTQTQLPGDSTTPRERARGGRVTREQRVAEIAELGLAFRSLFRSLRRLRGRDTHLAEGELSHAQYELLVELYERGALSAGELATAAQLTPATVTQMLEHLAASGHVERARSECDKRVVVSRLSARGRREIEAKRERWQGRWEQALADVEGEELRAATRVLTRLRAVFEDDVEG